MLNTSLTNGKSLVKLNSVMFLDHRNSKAITSEVIIDIDNATMFGCKDLPSTINNFF